MAQTPPTNYDDPATTTPGSTETQSPLAEAGQQAKDEADHLATRAADIGFKQADRGREQAADGVAKVAQTIRRVSSDIEGQPAIADAATGAADQADRFAAYLREHDARDMINSVEDAARRQPLLFLGAAFALGVAASRLVKAAGSGSASETKSRSAYGGAASLGSKPYRATGSAGHNGGDGFEGEGI